MIWLEIGHVYQKGFKMPEVALKVIRSTPTQGVGHHDEGTQRLHAHRSRVRLLQVEITKFNTVDEIWMMHEHATIGRGDAFNDLGLSSLSSEAQTNKCNRRAASGQMRKMKIIVWAVDPVQQRV